jgi:hypothetical protein
MATSSADEETTPLGAAGKRGMQMATLGRQQTQQEQMSRKFLAAIANIDFVLGHSLAGICRRLGENGLKFADQVFKRTKVKQTHKKKRKK